MTTVATRSSQHVWELGARAGYAASGLVHVLIGALAVQLALGSSSSSVDESGAFGQIASTPFGAVVLWCCVVAFAALGAWQAAAAISGASGGASRRAKAGGKAVVHLALAATALAFARGGAGSGGASGATAELMRAPGGRALVGVVGVGIVAVGAYHVHKGWTRGFLDDLRALPGATAGRVARRAGVVGYVAKGVALGVVGVLFVVAAATADPQHATGLDGALQALRDAPAGPLVLLLVAAGLVAFGGYCAVRSRFGRL